MVRGADGCASTAALVEWSALKAVQKVGRKPHLYRLATAQKPYYLSIFTFVVPASDRQTPLHFGVQKRCSSLFWKDSIKIYELSWQVYIYITCMRCGHQAFAWKETFFPTCQVRVSRYLQRFNSFFLPSFTFITFSSTSSTSSYQFRMQGRAPGPEPHRELRMPWRAPAHKRREKARYNVRIDAR